MAGPLGDRISLQVKSTAYGSIVTVHGEVLNFESEVYRADGTRLWISENAHVVRDAEGRPIVVRVGRYGPYLEREVDGEAQRANLPEELAPDELAAMSLARRDEVIVFRISLIKRALAFFSAMRMRVAKRPYWVRWASSEITMMSSRSDNTG